MNAYVNEETGFTGGTKRKKERETLGDSYDHQQWLIGQLLKKKKRTLDNEIVIFEMTILEAQLVMKYNQ